jgi:predicted LPLAT superfamily acyltransferase
MPVGALLLFAVTAAFLVGFAIAARLARRRYLAYARSVAALNDEMERRLIKLGVGLGIGA